MDFEICAQAPEFWKRLTIEEVCTRITSGGTPSRRNPEFFINGTVPWVKTQELQDGWIQETEEKITEEALKRSSAKLLPPNTVMLAMYGATVGQLGILGSSMTCNQACCALIVDKNIADFRYVYYLLRLHREAIKGLATGAAQQNLSAAQIKQFKFAFPDLETQTRIADALFALDDKTDLNRHINQTLEAMAQAIFKSWFVDFDPVKAKIAAIEQGQDPLRAAMRAISGKTDAELDQMPRDHHDQLAATAALFPDEIQESELGVVPKGWVVVEMRALADVISKGTTPSRHDLAKAQDEPSVSFIKVKDIEISGEISREQLELVARSIHETSLKRSIVKTDDLLFSIAGTIGRTAVVDADLDGSNMNQAIAFIRLRQKSIHLPLCWFTLRAEKTQNFIGSKVVQAVQANASLANVGEIPVTMPSEDILDRWNALVSPILGHYRLRLHEIRKLSQLRDTLLPELLSGELRVNLTQEAIHD